MTLVEKLSEDMKVAMKAGDRPRLEVLRFIIAGVQAAQKEKNVKQSGAPLTDDEAVAVLQKEAKRRKESIELFRQGKRDDLVKKEEADLVVIYEYIPKELSAGEIAEIVHGLHAQGFADFNALMRETMKAVKGRAGGEAVGAAIKKELSG